MQTGRYLRLAAMHDGLQKLLPFIDARRLGLRPHPGRPTVAELIALSLLDLDRLASDPNGAADVVPGFANDFLNRRLARRLIDRYSAQDFVAEFDRRFGTALKALSRGPDDGRLDPAFEHLRTTLAELESALRPTDSA